MALKSFGLLVIVAAIVYRWYSHQQNIHQQDNEEIVHRYILDFLSDEMRYKLQKIFENISFEQVQSNWSRINDIGEAEDPNQNNQCTNPYLILNTNENKCQLPVRVDVAAHYIKSGGYNGLKENYEKLISRMVYFVSYNFNYTNLLEFQEIFDSKEFTENAQSICQGESSSKSFLRRFQANFILHIPGQNLPHHFDVPYFHGASRYIYPKWFMVVMERSGLFQNRRIPQVQIVTYLHDNNDTDRDNRGGEFVVWDKGIYNKPLIVETIPNSAIFVDGTKGVHTTTTLYPNNRSLPLHFDKDQKISLIYNKNDKVWRLYDKLNGNKRIYVNEEYTWNDVRASIAWRAWCFDNESIAKKYDPYSIEKGFELKDILLILKKDLSKRWGWSLDKINKMNALDFALALNDEYIKYPYSDKAWISTNYCAVFRLLNKKFPSTKSILMSVQELIGC